MRRVGPIEGKSKPQLWRPTPLSLDDILPFAFDPGAPEDRAALIIARGHQRRR
jgi:hypothetical protein